MPAIDQPLAIGARCGVEMRFGGVLPEARRHHMLGLLDGHAIDIVSEDDHNATIAECLMMGMRLSEGVPLASMDTRFGRRAVWLNEAAMARYIESDMLEIEGGNLRATPAGRLLLDGILADLSPAG